MGFRTNTYAKVWQVTPKNDRITDMRISISHKNKDTGEYVTDFSGFVSAIGSTAAQKAAKLKEGDRIKLGDVDVSRSYDKEAGKEYTNFKIFSFDIESGYGASDTGASQSKADSVSEPYEGESNDLPF